MNVKPFSILLILFCLILFLSACSEKNPAGSDDDQPNQPNPDLISKQIGPNGGSITSKDGRVTLDFPEGALSSTETITITPIEEDDLGPEFDEVLNEFGFGIAYEMGPDGLSFEEPVTVTILSEQVVTQQGDSVSISPELLFTNEGNGTVALDSLRMSVDEESGGVTIVGELHHFSEVLRAGNFIHFIVFKVFDVPDEVVINDKFIVRGEIDEFTPFYHFDATYVDLSEHPIQRDFNPSNQLMQQVFEAYSYDSYIYTCTQVGMGTFKAKGSVIISKDADKISNNIFIDGLVVDKQINCFLNIPMLKSPVNLATGVDLKVTLEWEPVDGATSYTVQIVEEGKEFSSEQAEERDVQGITTEVSGLKPNTTYKWRVRANNDNEGEVSEWSEVWTFTTKEESTATSPEAKLDLQKQCVEHPDASRIANLFGFSIENNSTKSKGLDFLKDDITEYTVKKSIELPDGTTKEVTASPNSEGQLLLDLEIYVYGNYTWEIADVIHQDEPVPFSGDISGVIKVTSDEQNPGECTL